MKEKLMNINSKIWIVFFMLIAIASFISCFPKIFMQYDERQELNSGLLQAFYYISSIAHLKIGIEFMFQFMGKQINNLPIYLTGFLVLIFLIAGILYYIKKSKTIIRILKLGIALIGFNSFFYLLILAMQLFSKKYQEYATTDLENITLPFIIISFLINFVIIFSTIILFRKLNEEKFKSNRDTAYENMEGTVFEDMEQKMAMYSESSVGQRFLNYIIDYLIMLKAIFIISLYIVVVVFNDISYFDIHTKLVLYISSIITFFIYYFFMEKIYGVTIGKIITNTRVVQENGDYITWKQAFIRSFSRMVPFETISTFSGYPWHDKLSSTYVVKEDAEFE